MLTEPIKNIIFSQTQYIENSYSTARAMCFIIKPRNSDKTRIKIETIYRILLSRTKFKHNLFTVAELSTSLLKQKISIILISKPNS